MTDLRRNTTVDHVVINTLYDTDDAAESMAELGFALTPKGYHTLGSVNYLIILGDSYLELVGLPRGGKVVRKEMLSFPLGINGLVFSEASSVDRYAYLVGQGFTADPPQEFSRPVECSDGTRDALFTAVRLAGDTFPAGRVYFCHHHTPELVWREEWMHHDNTAFSVAAMTVVCTNPGHDAQAYGRCIGQAPEPDGDGWRIRLSGNRREEGACPMDILFNTEADYRERFGELGCDSLERESYFGCVRVRVRSLDAVRSALGQPEGRLSCKRLADGVIAVQICRFNCLLEFVEE